MNTAFTPRVRSLNTLPRFQLVRLFGLTALTAITLTLMACATKIPAPPSLRTRLAQLGLDAERILLPSELLSGGERLKGALAAVLYGDQPTQLLLLDEPSNHLDLPSLQALEQMLCRYQGTLLVASHDALFLQRLQLTAHLHMPHSELHPFGGTHLGERAQGESVVSDDGLGA